MSQDGKTMSFSERMGIVPVRTALQIDSMDEALRNSLWNLLTLVLWNKLREYGVNDDTGYGRIAFRIWIDHLKRRLDRLKRDSKAVADLEEYFFVSPWPKVYEFVEFIANDRDIESIFPPFCDRCNYLLEREGAGYRFIGKILSPVVSEAEVASLEAATSYQDVFKPVSNHLSTALKHLADKTSPDYRNSIKESISAVEAACQIVTGDPKATLGQAAKKLEENGVNLHPAFRIALEKMYGYTNDAEGIRHALLDEATLDADDARFMLVSCSAFVNYLKAKSSTGTS